MAKRRGWPVAVVPVGEVSTGSAVFLAQGKHHGLVVVKAAFRLRAGQHAEIAPAPEILDADEHRDRSPLRSVRAPCDLVPFREKCDVWLRGHCHAPAGRSVQVATTRLAVYREQEALIDKSLHVYGNRPAAGAPPEPFQRLPIEYERAYGGPGVADNPVGTGAKEGSLPPNVVHPTAPTTPAGYGPLARYWRARKHGLSDEVRAGLERRIVEIPDGFDWSYFQSAPRDQRCAPLRGDEWILLEGMHPAVVRLQCGLPAVRAEARLWSRAATRSHPGLPVPLVADELGIDADDQTFTICWRGSFPIPSLDLLASLCVGAGLSFRGQGVDWAPVWRRMADVVPDLEGLVEGAAVAPEVDLMQTAFVSPEEVADRLAKAAPLPFAKLAPSAAPSANAHAEEQRRAGAVLPWETRSPSVRAPAATNPAATKVDAASAPPPAVPAPAPSRPAAAVAPSGPPPPTPSSPWAVAPAPPERPGAASTAPPAQPSPPAQVAPPAPLPLPPSTPAVRPPAAPPFAGPTSTPRPAPVAPAGPVAAPPGAGRPPVPTSPPAPQRSSATIPPPDGPAGAALPASFGRHTGGMPAVPSGASGAAGSLPFQAPAARPARAFPPSGLEDDEIPPSAPPDDQPLERGNSVPTLTDGAFHVVTLAWSVKPPTPSLTAIVKGTFDLVADGAATIRAECDFPNGDVHLDDDLTRSVTYASDFAVFKPKADVTVVGTAHAPRGRSTAMEVGFRLGAGGRALTRRIAVLGDRQWSGVATSMTAPAGFDVMPLTWERAYGGEGHERNPVGVGHGARKDASGAARLPNLERPESLIKGPADRPAPNCFAPIPELWRPRWVSLGTYDASWRLNRWPYFPEDFDYSYFQSAPDEQQVDYLRGDEPYEIWGLLPGAGKIAGTLPALRVRCFAARTRAAGGELQEIPLNLDTCSFDLDAMKVNLVWRGLLEVSAEDAPELEGLFVTAEPLSDRPATMAQIAMRFARQKWRVAHPEEAIDELDGAANDGDVDPELALDLIRAEQARAEAVLRAVPFGAAAVEPQPMPLPARPTPEAVAAQLRAAGASEPDVEAAVAALSAPPAAGQPPASALRALLERLVTEGRAACGIDWTGADLAGAKLAGGDLREALLVGATLRAADLTGAKLDGAQMSDCDLRGVTLEGASLDGADLTGANLDDASLRGSSLADAVLAEVSAERCDFTGARGTDVSFEAANLTMAKFAEAELPGADFSKATLDDASFEAARLPDVRLYDAHGERAVFRSAVLKGARADGVKLPGAVMDNASAEDSVWEQADLSSATLTRAKLTGSSLVKANCEAGQLSGCDIKEGRLKGANLARAQLVAANLMQASLEGADLSKADLRGANLHGAELWKATLSGALLDDAIVTGTKLET